MVVHLRAALPCLTALALTVLAGGAQAQPSPDQQSAIRSSCRSDFMSKCSGVPRGGKEALDCLRKNVATLSPACKTAVSATIPAAAPVEAKPAQAAPAPPPAAAAPAAVSPAAPPASSQRAVTSAPPPPAAPSRPAAPKPQQTAKPAPAPAAPAPPPPEPVVPLVKIEALPVPVRLAVIRSCRQDQDAVCSSVRAGAGRLITCLAANSRALSPACKTALDKALR
jgi:hypothetical protein